MAGLLFTVTTSAAIAISTSPKTAMRISAPAAIGVRVKSITVTGDGTNPTAGKALVEIVRGASGGTAGGGTTVKAIAGGHTGSIQTTANENFSAEPTATAVIKKQLVHPQGGTIIPVDKVLNPGESLIVRITGAGAFNVQCEAECEE